MPKFASNVDLQKNELQNARIHNLSGAPGSPVEGQLYFDSTGKHGYIYTGTAQAWMLIDSYQPKSTFLTLVDSISNGIMTRLGAGSVIGRTMTGGTGITITNGDGIAGAPTFALSSGIVTPGTSPKVTYDTYGRVTAGAALTATDIPTLTASYISNFDTQVKTNPINLHSTPTGDLAMGSHRITGLTDPSSSQDAATKAYVDATVQGLDIKSSVKAASTANIAFTGVTGTTLTLASLTTLDGVALMTGDRVLIKDQTDQRQNGLYSYNSVGGVLTRTNDFTNNEPLGGNFFFVEGGTVNADSGFVCTSDGVLQAGLTYVYFTQFSGAGQITAGYGLTKGGVNGNYLRVGDGNGISCTEDSVNVALNVAAGITFDGGQQLLLKLDGGSLTLSTNGVKVTAPKILNPVDCSTVNPWVITHNAGTQDLIVQVYEKTTMTQILCDIVNTSVNTTTITFATAPTSAQYRAIILG